MSVKPSPRELRRMQRVARWRLEILCKPSPLYSGKDMRRAGGDLGKQARAAIFRGLMTLALLNHKTGGLV